MVNSLGFSLEKVAAMQEHGIRGDFFYQGLAARHLMKVPSVFFTGTWVRGINFKMSRAEVPMTVQNGFDMAFSMLFVIIRMKRHSDILSQSTHILHIRTSSYIRRKPSEFVPFLVNPSHYSHGIRWPFLVRRRLGQSCRHRQPRAYCVPTLSSVSLVFMRVSRSLLNK